MSQRRSFLLTFLLVVLASIFFAIDLQLPLGVAGGIPYVGVVLLAVRLPDHRLILALAALCSTLTVVGAFWSPPGGILWMAITNRSLAILAIWTTAIVSWRRRQAEDELRRANRELDAFVHTVSHDLRSPLTPILGWANLLREEYGHCLREDGTRAVTEIERQGRRMDQMLEDLLQFARVGYLERPSSPVDATEVLLRVVAARWEEAVQAGCELKHGPLPPVAVPETLLTQLFDNVVGNAIRYAPGRIEIGGERRGGKVRYFVRDHGPGIPAAERETIFEVFSRGSTADEIPGTGIGLATVRKIALHLGGRAWVEETRGGGSTFWVELPDGPVTKTEGERKLGRVT